MNSKNARKGRRDDAIKHEQIQSNGLFIILVCRFVFLFVCLFQAQVIRENTSRPFFISPHSSDFIFFIIFTLCVCGTPSHQKMAISNTINNKRAKRRKEPPRSYKGHCDIKTMVGLALAHTCKFFQIFATHPRKGWLLLYVLMRNCQY